MKDELGQNHYSVPAFDDSGTQTAEDLGIGDGTFSNSREELLRDFGGAVITSKVIDELLDKQAEMGMLAGTRRIPISDESEKWRKIVAIDLKKFQWIKDHPGPVGTYAALHADGIDLHDDINKHLNQQQFADTVVVRWKVTRDEIGNEIAKQIKQLQRKLEKHETRKPVHLTKAAVNNAVLDFQKAHGLPPRSDQRKDETRDKQSEVRKKQLMP